LVGAGFAGADTGGGAGCGLKHASIAAAAAAEVTNLFFMALRKRGFQTCAMNGTEINAGSVQFG
jgi:hypothetical protein